MPKYYATVEARVTLIMEVSGPDHVVTAEQFKGELDAAFDRDLWVHCALPHTIHWVKEEVNETQKP